MAAIFIVDPYANRWRASRRKDEALAALRSAGVDLEFLETERLAVRRSWRTSRCSQV